MRAFVLISALAVVAYGRPEPPSGYSYPAPAPLPSIPSGSYGVPSGPHGGLNLGSLGGSLGGLNLGGGHGLGLGGGHGGLGISSIGGSLNQGGFTGSSLLTSGPGSSGINLGGSFGGISGGSQLVQKHIYVHVPPPEPEEFRPQRPIHVAAPQKHYKIIFIKAPTAPTPTVPTIPIQQQNEEKTLVYVLVKKPEEAPEIQIPTAAPTQPSKPEVYFIKYKTQKEGGAISGGAISGGAISGGSLAGGSITGADLSGGSLNLGGDILGGSHQHGSISGGSISSISSGPSSSYGPPGHTSGGPY